LIVTIDLSETKSMFCHFQQKNCVILAPIFCVIMD
jgi:hypothetical protein